jgi:hypothetical protein
MKHTKKIKEDQLIYVRQEYSEAVQSKRDVLETQKNIIQILKNIKRYHLIRTEELKLKLILLKKIKELKINLSKINNTLPKIKIPDNIKKESNNKETKKVRELSGSEMKQTDIEKELLELQRKLKELE